MKYHHHGWPRGLRLLPCVAVVALSATSSAQIDLRDFSGVQGRNQFSYLSYRPSTDSYRELVSGDNAFGQPGPVGDYGWFEPAAPDCSVFKFQWWPERINMHPGYYHDAVLAWQSPTNTNVRLNGWVENVDPGGGDGIAVSILVGTSLVYFADLPNGGRADFDFTVAMGAGETLYFRTNKKGSTWWDAMQLGLMIPDTDGDGLTDDEELQVYGTDPFNPDTDGDGLWDGTEVDMAQGAGCPNPLNADSDGDSLSDGYESFTLNTNPCQPDTDGDGIPDGMDPLPLDPGGTSDYVEDHLRDLCVWLDLVDITLFIGPNDNARMGRRTALCNRATAGANLAHHGNYTAAMQELQSFRERIDNVLPVPDWIQPSGPKDMLRIEVDDLIMLLGYLL